MTWKLTRTRENPLRTSSETPRAAADVHVALERGLDLGQPHLARGGDVDERRGEAGGQRVQQVLGRVRAGVGAEQDRGLAGVDGELLDARAVLLPGAVEALDRGAVVGAVRSSGCVARNWNDAERRVCPRGVERAVELLGVDAVAGDGDDLGHTELLGEVAVAGRSAGEATVGLSRRSTESA